MFVSYQQLRDLEDINYEILLKFKDVNTHSYCFQRKFSIIIPAYNEERRIGPVLKEVCETILNGKLPWEVIVSIDGNDRTDILVKALMENYPFLNFIKGSGRNGKGFAIRRALDIAKGDFLILMDADNSVSFSDVLKSVSKINDNDAVILERYSSMDNEIPFLRRLASRGFNFLVRSLLGLRVDDTQSGYKIIRTDIARRAFESITVTNTFFDVALLYKIKNFGGKIIEIPVKYNHDGESKFNVFSEVLGQGLSLLAFRIRYSPIYKHIPEKIKTLYYKKFRWI